MEYSYTTSQAPDKGVQVGSEPIPTPNAISATTQPNITGFGGNLIEAGIVTNGTNRAVYMSKAYPANADGKQRPGATVEYSSEFSVGEGIGGTPELPWGYIRAEFLESSGTQYILTNQLWNGSTVSYKVAAQGGAGSPSWYNNRTGSTEKGTYGGIYQQNAGGLYAGYKSSRTFVGGDELYPFIATMSTEYGFTEARTNQKTHRETFEPWYPVDDIPVALFAVSFLNTSNINYSRNSKIQRIFWFKVSKASIPQFSYIPAIDKSGTPCMFDEVSKQPFYNSGEGAFIVGFTLEQALQLSKLPAIGGSLTISLPWEAQLVQYNAKVEAALQTAKNKGWTITVQYRDPEPDSAIYNKYAECTNLAQMKAVNADFANDLTSEGEWVYPLPELVNCAVDWGQMVFGDHKTQHGRTRLKKWCVPLPKLKYSNSMFRYCEALETEVWELPALTYSNFGMFAEALKNITYIKLILPSCTQIEQLFHLGATKAKHIVVEGDKITNALFAFPYMKNIEKIELNTSKIIKADGLYYSSLPLTEFPLEYPALSTAPRMLADCQITGYQAITILNSIPTWTDGKTHEITLGIHIDYQNDAEVLAAIDAATAKGWTVTTQWTGTPTNTSSTFGLKRIWVRKREDEQGEYAAQDGTHWQVEWCDNISAPDGSTPEDHGYELFRSVEVAAEYWELEPYVYPEEEEFA